MKKKINLTEILTKMDKMKCNLKDNITTAPYTYSYREMQLTAIFIFPISRVSTSAILTRKGKCTKIDCTYIA